MEVLESNLSRQLAWIAAADARKNFVFTVACTMLGVMAAVGPKPELLATLGAWAWLSGAAALALLASALLILFFSSRPVTDGPVSLVYFGEVAKLKREAFESQMSSTTEESLAKDLAAQCHRNAQIATKRFSGIRSALVCLYAGVIPWIPAVWLLFSAQVAESPK